MSEITDPIDAAFPTDLYSGGQPVAHMRGLSKRELFAAMAMQGLLSNELIMKAAAHPVEEGRDWYLEIDSMAIKFAETLIDALNRR